MKFINYHHLIYFREIARSGSISKASEVLKVGQPALSFQLKKLEDYLGVELFIRKNRGLFLTEQGKIVLEYAEKINDLGQELAQIVEQKIFTKRIHLKIGVLDSIPKHLTTNIVDFAHKQTGCYLSIMEGTPDYLLRELEAYLIDVFISDHNPLVENSKQIFSKRIIDSPVYAYTSKKLSYLKKNFPHSLNGQPVIFPTHHCKLRTDLEHYFNVNKIYVDPIAEVQDSMFQKILAIKGDGVIFLPNLATSEFEKEKKLIQLGCLKSVYVQYYMIYSKKLIENTALEILINQNYSKIDFT